VIKESDLKKGTAVSLGWDSYLCRVNGELASICLDLDQQTDPSHPSLLWIWIDMLMPRPDGLSSREEADTLGKLEDALTERLTARLDARFVGRITVERRREFYFYTPNAPLDATVISDALHLFPEYCFDWGTEHDPEWSQYHSVLYPAEEDFEKIKNRRVLDVLEKHGDRLDQAREIRHWAYFDKESDRESFIRDVRPLGYSVANKSEDQTEEPPWGVCLVRTDHPDALDEVVVELFRFAAAHNGEYDGWESPIIALPN
jgi:hypothetical protein